jgi:hypothetical protein
MDSKKRHLIKSADLSSEGRHARCIEFLLLPTALFAVQIKNSGEQVWGQQGGARDHVPRTHIVKNRSTAKTQRACPCGPRFFVVNAVLNFSPAFCRFYCRFYCRLAKKFRL